MKPTKALKFIAAFAALPIIFSACNKNLQEPKEERDVEMFSSKTTTSLTTICNAPAINLRVSPTDELNYFFIGSQTSNPNSNPEKQNFLGSNFSSTSLIKVTAVGGTPLQVGGTGIGVSGPLESGGDLNLINPGEVLQLSIGSDFPRNFSFTGFDLILGSSPGTGRVECMYNNQIRATVPFNKTNAGNFTVSYNIPNDKGAPGMASFNSIRIICETGKFALRGPWPRPLGGEPPTRLKFANFNLPIAMRLNGTTDNVLGYTNTYINRGIWPAGEQSVSGYEDNRQYRTQLPMRTFGSGEFNATNENKWLKISATGGKLLYAHGAIGVGQDGGTRVNNKDWSIDNSESIVIEPGTDFPSQYFAMFEFRSDNDATGDVLEWEAFDGTTLVASGTTPSARNRFNRINPAQKFNKVVIKGTSSTSRARVGMGGGRVITAYPLCDN